MRRFSFGFTMVALPAFALSLMLAGCSGGGGGKESGSSSRSSGDKGSSDTDTAAQKKDLKELEPGKGVLKGKITLKGKPDLTALTNQLHDEMKKKDTEYCMKGTEPETTEFTFRVSDKGLLGNVFVWVVPAPGTFFKVDKKQLDELPKTVDTHQPHCAFLPHCLFHFPEYKSDPKNPRARKQTGQTWVIHNDATVGHNTNFAGGSKNKGENLTLAAKSEKKIDNLQPDSKEVTISCNIHPWMRGYMWVVDTPYYAVSHSDTYEGKSKVEKSDPKFGTYEIKGLPAGKVRVIAWHEKLGYLNQGGGKGEEIEIKADGATEKDFEAAP